MERRGRDGYGLGALGAAVAGNAAVSAMVEHHPLLYADLADPVALLRREGRGEALSRYWPYAEGTAPATLAPEQVAADYPQYPLTHTYDELIAAIQAA